MVENIRSRDSFSRGGRNSTLKCLANRRESCDCELEEGALSLIISFEEEDGAGAWSLMMISVVKADTILRP